MNHHSLKKRFLSLNIAMFLIFIIITGFSFFPFVENKADYSQLIGRWVRPDGGYVLDIRNVQPDGKLEAAYLNPKSINISKANVSVKADRIALFVELRDRYYPGSYYTLTYDSKSDRLIGVYHHLGIGQNINVFFSRKHGAI